MNIRLNIVKDGSVAQGAYFTAAGVIVDGNLALMHGFRVEPEDAATGLILFAEYCKAARALATAPPHADGTGR